MSSEVYTIKEMLNKVIDQNEKALVTQTELLERAKNVDSHLSKLNSKVALHVKEIDSLKREHIKAKTVFGTLTILMTGAWTVVTFVLR